MQIHPDDAAAHAVADGDVVDVRSMHGSVRAVTSLDTSLRRGVVSLPHGFVDTNVNGLTSSREAVDEQTGMVRLSGVPVSVHPTTAGV